MRGSVRLLGHRPNRESLLPHKAPNGLQLAHHRHGERLGRFVHLEYPSWPDLGRALRLHPYCLAAMTEDGHRTTEGLTLRPLLTCPGSASQGPLYHSGVIMPVRMAYLTRSVLSAAPSFSMMLVRCVSTVLMEIPNLRAIP